MKEVSRAGCASRNLSHHRSAQPTLRILPLLLLSAVVLPTGCSGSSPDTSSKQAAAKGAGDNQQAMPPEAPAGGDSAGNQPAAEASPAGGHGESQPATGEGESQPAGGHGQTAGSKTAPAETEEFAGQTPPAQTETAAETAPEEPRLPENVAEWKPDDLRTAVRRRDPRFSEAVEALTASKPDDAQVASLLVELLEMVGEQGETDEEGSAKTQTEPSSPNSDAASPETDSSPPAQSPPTNQTPPPYNQQGFGPESGQDGPTLAVQEIVRVLVTALGKNGTEPAWNGLRRLLAGDIQLGIARPMVAEWVLSTAVRNYGGAEHPTHQLLFQAVTSPSTLQGEQLAADALKKRALALAAGYAAQAMDQLIGIPEPEKPNQQKRFRNPGTGRPGIGEAAQPPAGDFNAGAANPPGDGGAGFGGKQANVRAGGANLIAKPERLESGELESVLKLLWHSEFLDLVQQRVEGGTSLAESQAMLALAATLPGGPIRQALYGHFQQSVPNPQPLVQAKFFRKFPRDPGLLVLLKLLPRRYPRQQVLNFAGSAAGGQQGARPNNPQYGAGQRQKKQPAQAGGGSREFSWLLASGQLLHSLLDRFHQAATSQGVGGVAVGNQGGSDLPIRFHDDAQIAAEYHLNWPADLEGRFSDVELPHLKVDYARVEQSQWSGRLSRYYRLECERYDLRRLNNGRWYDYLTSTPDRRHKRSVDVVFTQQQQGGQAGGAGLQGQPPPQGGNQQGAGDVYVIEVLSVEIPEPTTQAESEEAGDRTSDDS